MSYELEHVEMKCPCPCGKGIIVYGSGSNDWGQEKEGMIEIWCDDCCEKYKFSIGGLLPKDFPDYKGDEEARVNMGRLHDIIANYRGRYAFQYWSDDLKKKRLHLYLTPEEVEEDRRTETNTNLELAIVYAKELADKYSLEDLKMVQHQMIEARYSTRLSGMAKDIAEWYKLFFKTIKLSNVIRPVNMAIRNYDAYKVSDMEDEEYLKGLRKTLKEAEAIYYKDFEEYELKRKSQLIPYELKNV